MNNPIVGFIIDHLYQWVRTRRERDLIKDTTRVNCKYDAFINSTVTDPLSFTIFEMTEKGELLIDDPSRVVDSEAAYFLFVNPETKWMVAVKNTDKNQARLIRKEPIEHFKVKLIQ